MERESGTNTVLIVIVLLVLVVGFMWFFFGRGDAAPEAAEDTNNFGVEVNLPEGGQNGGGGEGAGDGQ